MNSASKMIIGIGIPISQSSTPLPNPMVASIVYCRPTTFNVVHGSMKQSTRSRQADCDLDSQIWTHRLGLTNEATGEAGEIAQPVTALRRGELRPAGMYGT